MPSELSELRLVGPATVEATADGAEDKPAHIHVAAYNGGLMRVAEHGRVVIDVEGIESPERVPLLADHENSIDAVLGSGAPARIEGRLAVNGTLSRTSERARRVIDLARDGVPLQASVAAEPLQTERITKGKQAIVNGRTIRADDGSFLLVRRSRLKHVAIVANGADDTTTINIAAAAAQPQKGGLMHAKIREWIEGRGFSPDNLSEQQINSLQAMYEAEKIAREGGDDGEANQVIEAARRERTRRTKIKGLIAAAIDSNPGCDLDALEQIADEAIKGGWTIQETELAIHRELLKRPNVGVPRATTSAIPTTPVLAAALLMRCGVSDEWLAKDRDFGPQVVEAAWKRRSSGLHATIAAALQADGKAAPHDGLELFHTVVQHQIQAGFSTVDLPGLLGTVGNKLLLDSFTRVDGTYERIAQQADFNNFLTYTMFRLDHTGEFAKVGPTGEIKHGKLNETTYTNRLETRGQMLTYSRDALINDDVNAFQQLFASVGRKARLAVEKALYSAIMEASDSFYTVAKGNRLTGTALSVEGLGLGEAAMLGQVAADGDPIYSQPAILLVPPGLKYLADQLWTSASVNQTPANNKSQGVDNPYRGRFRVESSPYLALAGMPGASNSNWYLVADPNNLPAFQVAYLRGQRQPTIETADAQFNTLGIQLRCYFDFGVARIDHRGALKASA
jgi:hypothetical protein